MDTFLSPQIISILIESFQKLPDLRGGYVRYSITVTGSTRFLHLLSYPGDQTYPSFRIYSRYTELSQFHHHIKGIYPQLPIPKFPPKKIIGNKTTAFIQDRIAKINQYFFRILQISEIQTCQPLMKLVAPWSPLNLLVLECAETGQQRLVQDFLWKWPITGGSNQSTEDERVPSEVVLQAMPIDIIIRNKLYRIAGVKRVKYQASQDHQQFVRENCSNKNGVIFCYNNTDLNSQAIANSLYQTFFEILPCVLFNTSHTDRQSAYTVFLDLVKLAKLDKRNVK